MQDEWKLIPAKFGYYWVDKGESKIQMLYLEPGKYYEENGHVEAWFCPGISRHRLYIGNFPKKWKWKYIELPKNEN